MSTLLKLITVADYPFNSDPTPPIEMESKTSEEKAIHFKEIAHSANAPQLSHLVPSSENSAPAPAPELDWKELPEKAYAQLAPLPMTVHGKQVDTTAVEMGTYHRYSLEDLGCLEVVVDQNGKLCLGSDAFPMNGIGYIFVMHSNGKIYATIPVESRIFHSSMINEEFPSPIAAGTMTVIDGIPQTFTENSGHFAPAGRLPFVLSELYRRGSVFVEQAKTTKNSFKPIPIEGRPVDNRHLVLKAVQPSPPAEDVQKPCLRLRHKDAQGRPLHPIHGELKLKNSHLERIKAQSMLDRVSALYLGQRGV